MTDNLVRNDEVVINEGLNTVSYIATDLPNLLRLVADEIEGKSIMAGKLFINTSMRHKDTNEHPYEFVVYRER